MPLLDDLINKKKSKSSIINKNKELLGMITKRQLKKFRKYRLIPKPVLQMLWHEGFLPNMEPPIKGMCIEKFLEFLNKGQCRDERNRARVVWLRDKIEEEECPSIEYGQEIYIKCGRGKFIPVSEIRKEPGTIF